MSSYTPEEQRIYAKAHYRANRERYRELQKQWKTENPEANRQSTLRWQAKNKERWLISHRATIAIWSAIKSGKLTRPDTCEECQRKIYVEAAHYNYVELLKVRWLCRTCHRLWDAAEPKTKVLV
jgi:hypothetical protein